MGDRWRPYSKGIFESVGRGRGGEREARRLPWIMPPCSQDGIISRSGTGDPIRCIDATIPQGFSMGLRKIRPVERPCMRACGSAGSRHECVSRSCVDRDRGKLGGVQDVTYVFRVHRKPGKNYLGFDTCTHCRTRENTLEEKVVWIVGSCVGRDIVPEDKSRWRGILGEMSLREKKRWN